MALLDRYVLVYGRLKDVFEAMRQAQAPTKFTRQYLKDLGFTSSNYHAVIPLLKGLGFLSQDGSPTQRYRDFLDSTRSWKVLAGAVREAYSDIFTIKAEPGRKDKASIQGKYKSTYNMTDNSADRAANTFLALIELCDKNVLYGRESMSSNKEVYEETEASAEPASTKKPTPARTTPPPVGLHYNIQIHLPASKDIEVYNAIFKSLKDHLID